MSEPLNGAVRALRRAHPDLTEIFRVDVDESGGIQLTARGAEGTRWFLFDDRGLIERRPEGDPALPLSRRLEAARPDWKVLSYRPGRRMVIRLQQGGLTNVIKGHRTRRSARAAVSQGLAEGATRRAGLRVPRLLNHDGANEALVFEYLECRELPVLEASAGDFGLLGERLGVFQRDPAAGDLKVFGPRDELGVLELWKGKVERATGALPADWQRTRDELEARSVDLPEAQLGLVHRDLHEGQLYLVGQELTLLDFDLLCAGDVALDAGNLVAHLRWRALRAEGGTDEAAASRCEHAFLEGLGRASERGFPERFSFYLASALLRLALVYRVRPRWSEQAQSLVPLARTELEAISS